MEIYTIACETEDPDYEYEVGLSYKRGHGVGQSNSEAKKWFSKAADKGHMESEYQLGLYLKEDDAESSFEYIRDSALKGYYPAISTLGQMYRDGIGTEISNKNAMECFSYLLINHKNTKFGELIDLMDETLSDESPEFQYLMAKRLHYRSNLICRDKNDEKIQKLCIDNCLKWILNSAIDGYVKAEEDMGDIYNNPKISGYPFDAMLWYGEAVADDSDYALEKLSSLINVTKNTCPPEIQYNVAIIYLNQHRHRKLFKEAMKLLHNSSQRGYIPSCHYLADQYLLDEQDADRFEKACELHLKAYSQDPSSINETFIKILMCEYQSISSELLLKIAKRFEKNRFSIDVLNFWDVYAMAANNGSAEAAVKLATFIGPFDGDVEKLNENSIKLYVLAANNGSPYAQYVLGCVYEHRGDPEHKAKDLFLKAAMEEEPNAQCKIAQYYEIGRDSIQSYDLAKEMYIAAAKKEHAESQYRLGKLFFENIETKHRYCKAFLCLNRAKENGYPVDQRLISEVLECIDSDPTGSEQFMLAAEYRKGKKIGKSGNLAFEYFDRSARCGHRTAIYVIGEYYEFGRLVKQSDSVALEKYTVSAELGEPLAQLKLGKIYLEGKMVHKDYETSIRYLLEASRNGNDAAIQKLAYLEKFNIVNGSDSVQLHEIAEKQNKMYVFDDLESTPYINYEVEQ